MRVFVAGGTGAIGRRLCAQLAADGHAIAGTTRSPDKVPLLRSLGVEPVVVDVYDAAALRAAVVAFRPDAVVHQLTDLPLGLDPTRMPDARERNARLRDVGTRHLVAAAVAAGAHRLVAQSIAFAYAKGPQPYDESAPLDLIEGAAGVTARGVASLEAQVLAAPLTGIVLRYGLLYGPHTGFDAPPRAGAVHVDAAAEAARRALERGERGIYNIAEDDGRVSIVKAREALGWDPSFRATGDGAART